MKYFTASVLCDRIFMTSQLSVPTYKHGRKIPLGIIEDYHYEKKGGRKILKGRPKKVKSGGPCLASERRFPKKGKGKEWLIKKRK